MTEVSAPSTPPRVSVLSSRPGADRPDAAPRERSAFERALHEAGEARREPEAPRSDRRDGDDKRKKRFGEGDAPTEGRAEAREAVPRSPFAGKTPPREEGGKADILGGLTQHPGALAQAEAPAEAGPVEPVDATAFARMLDEAAARATMVRPGEPLTLRFPDLRAPLQGVTIARASDGALSLSLAANAHATQEVTRSLESLRRRLEARGLTIGELKMADEVDTPVAGAARSGEG